MVSIELPKRHEKTSPMCHIRKNTLSTAVTPPNVFLLCRLDGGHPNDFVHDPDGDCDDIWSAWPSIQETGITNDNVVVYQIPNSVGNAFFVVDSLIEARHIFKLSYAALSTSVMPL